VRARLNGHERELPDDASVADAVRLAGVEAGERGVAVALDGEVVPRERWSATPLHERAAVEVVRAAAGG
jgi:sulfur carrier protein